MSSAGDSIGYQSQSGLVGALGGTLIGAGAGILGGLIGQSAERGRRQAEIQAKLAKYRAEYERSRAQIEAFRANRDACPAIAANLLAEQREGRGLKELQIGVAAAALMGVPARKPTRAVRG